ncbi:MAG TPA: aminotransferase class I/II-fold pyridoxal phosphate-dependent enzyme, partial [Candidatus Cloacimonas sp.]|nr:aminotransferase class I/II-fold pyridoxal phosphate-dependent enzyme [Candidatus Cloacimonas sp.]
MLYSTALPPALIAGTQKALEIVDKEGARLVQKLLDNKRYLWERLDKHGFQVLKGEASICS